MPEIVVESTMLIALRSSNFPNVHKFGVTLTFDAHVNETSAKKLRSLLPKSFILPRQMTLVKSFIMPFFTYVPRLSVFGGESKILGHSVGESTFAACVRFVFGLVRHTHTSVGTTCSYYLFTSIFIQCFRQVVYFFHTIYR